MEESEAGLCEAELQALLKIYYLGVADAGQMASENKGLPQTFQYSPKNDRQRKPLTELTNLELLYLEMADRFPSIEDLDSGAQPSEAPTGGSFLDRERAILGDDADLFSSGDQQTARVEDGDNDLLGGDFSEVQQPSEGVEADELDGFESSFPAIDTRNEVCLIGHPLKSFSDLRLSERWPRRLHHQHIWLHELPTSGLLQRRQRHTSRLRLAQSTHLRPRPP